MLSQENKVSVTSVIFIEELLRSLADEHRLADDLAIDQDLYRLRCVLQRKPAPNAWFQFSFSGEPNERLDVGGGNLGVGFVEPTNTHADCLDSLDEQIIGTGEGRGAAEKAKNQNASAPSEAAQRFFECRAVDRIVDDIDAAATGQIHNLVAEAARIFDRVVGALLETDRTLFLGAGGCDHTGAMELSDLNGREADAAGSTMDQHPISGFEPATL